MSFSFLVIFVLSLQQFPIGRRDIVVFGDFCIKTLLYADFIVLWVNLDFFWFWYVKSHSWPILSSNLFFQRRIQNPEKHLRWSFIQNLIKHLRWSFFPSTIFAKRSILDVWPGCEYVFCNRETNSRESIQVHLLTLKRFWMDLLLNFTIAMT